ncbi:MAG: PEP/pyruvate-binding domain-containing protein [Calditrichia bacterium]|nr:PEP/pyruvate-binding domain-containing protein [Calditrichia bacterium]
MVKKSKSMDKLFGSLLERAKELNCIYEVEEIIQLPDLNLKEILIKIGEVIPSAMQFPDICRVKISYQDEVILGNDFEDTNWYIGQDIKIENNPVGWIKIFYLEKQPKVNEGFFLKDEIRVLDTIAKRVGDYIMYQNLRSMFGDIDTEQNSKARKKESEWYIVLDLLKKTDPDVFVRISRKMLNNLVWKGIAEAEELLQQFLPLLRYGEQDIVAESNRPLQTRALDDSDQLSQKVFDIATRHMSDDDILNNIRKWIQQDKTSFLVRATSNINSSLTDISQAIRRYFQMAPGEGMELSPSARIGVRAGLIRRFLTDQLEYLVIAKNFIRVRDFYDILQHLIFPPGSHGKLGGKTAGVLLAYRILKNFKKQEKIFANVKVPKTWYISSDEMIQFMYYNNLEEMLEQKYKPIDEVRKEYPHLVQLFKNSHFSNEIVQGISMALDDFGNSPLIVRSSSVLEDRLGSAFSGKYKSLFLANQGTKLKNLEALLDAIAEVYASTLGPDPMQYRSERGLIDFHEEMGIMIQEVVGKQVGDYYFPSFAGVAFSNNEFRWSPRIKREDGLIRLVPGLGTRAVDRLSDDYPILVAAGQPGLRANVSMEDMVRYSPQKIDVLNFKTNAFETIEIKDLMKKHGNDYPGIENMVSLYERDHLKKPMPFQTDFTEEDTIFTFDGLINETPFIKEIDTILKTLQNTLAYPVDIEFASDGENFYLLQCRPQSYSKYDAPSPIPKELPEDQTIFTANRYISNGTVPDITHIVYVNPDQYSKIETINELKAIGRAISKLNQILPKRQFILMGPGRWGSRGDIKLGVNVTYSDINNTAVLIEIARKKGNYVPDLSFGTHFFQDLVEASIRYLPLYPDEKEIIFNEEFLIKSPNALFELLPAYSNLSDIIHVIEVPEAADGMVLRVLMNADLDMAVGILSPRSSILIDEDEQSVYTVTKRTDHWHWRSEMVEKMASQLDPQRFGVKSLYLIGSTQNTTAQAGSDIDLLVNFSGTRAQKNELLTWLDGWSLCLDEINFLRTGFKAGGLLDIHFVTEDELSDLKSLSEKLNLNIDGLRELPLTS